MMDIIGKSRIRIGYYNYRHRQESCKYIVTSSLAEESNEAIKKPTVAGVYRPILVYIRDDCTGRKGISVNQEKILGTHAVVPTRRRSVQAKIFFL